VNRWEQLLEVQAHDTTADQLVHRSKTLPERAQLDAAMTELARLDASLAEVNERRDELTRAQKRLEDEIASLGEKAEQAEAKKHCRTTSGTSARASASSKIRTSS
jgi:predicted  nucleic acid-binding Zn-ribbon protein